MSELAALMRVCRATIYRKMRAGMLPYPIQPLRRFGREQIRFSKEHVERWLGHSIDVDLLSGTVELVAEEPTELVVESEG